MKSSNIQPSQVNLQPLIEIMATLRGPKGCPWDREQSHKSLLPHFLEEMYEFFDAVEKSDSEAMCEELGDVLLQIVFHAQIAEENGHFSIQNVIDAIGDKMVRRHPHVFGNTKKEKKIASAQQQIEHWQTLKRKEGRGLLDGVSRALPALARAQRLSERAARIGFDWEKLEHVLTKFEEEFAELKEAIVSKNFSHIEEEFGDILFVWVNAARKLKIEAEHALQLASNKFIRRFTIVEKLWLENSDKEKSTIEELEKMWVRAKKKLAASHD